MLYVTIHGNLTRDPEMRVSPQGTPFTKFAIASNRKFKKTNGTLVEAVDYLEIEARGKQAEVIKKYFATGSEFVGGARLQQENWEDPEAKKHGLKAKRSRHVGKLEWFEFCGKRVSDNDEHAEGDESFETSQPAAEAVAAGQ